MAVMAAGMHDADVLSVVGRADFRSERQIDLFGDRQRVHVRAQRNHRSRFPGVQQSDHAGMRDPGLDGKPERTQVSGDDAGGAHFAIG